VNLHSGKLQISRQLSIPLGEINLSAIRSQGAGGQNVNKVASAIHLRFDIKASSLPDSCKARLLALQDQRITRDGVVVIKAQTSRSREKNRDEALNRLRQLVASVLVTRKSRIATRATRASQRARLDSKSRRGRDKQLRKRISADD
jgi:ribosome-associated protein